MFHANGAGGSYRVNAVEFAKNTAEALLPGDPSELNVIRDSATALLTDGVERVKGTLNIGHNTE